MNDKKENNHFGELAELIFSVEAMKRGFNVARPLFDRLPYDFIIEGGGKCLKIQVKGCSRKEEKSKNYKVGFSRGKGKYSYEENDIDYLAAYVHPEDAWYILPISLIKGKKRITINKKVEKFKNNWEVG